MRLKLEDRRSLLGAIALTTTGGILSWMLEIYLHALSGAPALTTSRLWWELVLNLQIFSAALMWFCFSDRIENTSGALQRLQRVRRLFGMIAVLVPTALGFFGVFQDWYTYRPQSQTLFIVVIVVVLFWFSALWVHSLVQSRRTSFKTAASMRYRILSLTPIYIILLLFLLDYPTGGEAWLVAMPTLAYFQGGMPFMARAFGWR